MTWGFLVIKNATSKKKNRRIISGFIIELKAISVLFLDDGKVEGLQKLGRIVAFSEFGIIK